MKCWLKNNPVYHKVYEYTEAGTYTITITEDTPCKFVIVGGGGGGAYSNYYGMFTRAQNGGSGAMVQGETTLTAGTYTVVVGAAGESKYQYVGAISGDAGGNSTFLGNTAGGGSGAYAHAGYFATDGYDGAGGTATAVDGAIGTNGKTGDTVGIYKNQYGAGGVNSASNGFAGYAMIDIVSDSSDYTYTVDDFTAKLIKETEKIYHRQVVFNASNDFQTFTVPSGVDTIHVDCVASRGNAGSSSGGAGGRIECDLAVTPNQTLYITVGEIPSSAGTPSYNASDIRTDNTGITDTTSLQSRLIVAGGGGSGSTAGDTPGVGGAGGGLTGGTGGNGNICYGGGGGTQSSGGGAGGSSAAYPVYGSGGTFGLGGAGYLGASGGAGWYGGGGGSGGGTYYTYVCSGGGGGSSYTDETVCSNVVRTQGYHGGEGFIIISYISDPSDYDEVDVYKAFRR